MSRERYNENSYQTFHLIVSREMVLICPPIDNRDMRVYDSSPFYFDLFIIFNIVY